MLYTSIIGRLGADSELKTSKNGSPFLTMRVASNEKINGENVTTWVRVNWYNDRASKMQEYFKKGNLVNAHGALRASMYDSKDGDKKISIDIMADRIDFVNAGSGNTQSNDSVAEVPKAQETNAVPNLQEAIAESPVDNDDLPF